MSRLFHNKQAQEENVDTGKDADQSLRTSIERSMSSTFTLEVGWCGIHCLLVMTLVALLEEGEAANP